jgi:glutamine cyclotransferase
MGIIISKKGNTEDNVDFSNYNGTAGNKQIMDRIETTKPVLSVNSETVKIVAAFEFEEDGWTINPLDKSLEDDIGNDFEDKQEAPPEEGAEVTPTNQGQGEVKR